MKELSEMGCINPGLIEELLWRSGILGSAAPKQSVESLLYLFGLHFALRAGGASCLKSWR